MKQKRWRLRWAQGGVEVIIRHTRDLFTWRTRRFWGIAIEYMLSVLWSYVMLFILLLYAFGLIFPIQEPWNVDSILPQWYGLILGMTCLIQFFISLWIDRRYDQGRLWRSYVWVIWYPLLYWMISFLTTVVAVPKTLFKKSNKRARWDSPDRGLRPQGGK
jgi:biofilm PGA synthesis N-glycosyltransferase PgaC